MNSKHCIVENEPEDSELYDEVEQFAYTLKKISKLYKHEIRRWIDFEFFNVKENDMNMMKNKLALYACARDLIRENCFTIEGLARELHVSLDVLVDVVMMRNQDPSLALSMGLINLHRQQFSYLHSNIVG